MEMKVKAIGKLYCRSGYKADAKVKEYVGIIWNIRENYVDFIRIDSDTSQSFYKEYIVDFKATKMLSKEARENLKMLAELKIKREEEDARHRKMMDFLSDEETKYKRLLRDSTGILSPGEFRQEAEKLFNKFSNGYYVRVGSCDDTTLTICDDRDVEKWPSPEKYSFIYREYDNCLSIYSDAENHSDYKHTLSRYAPSVIYAFEKIAHKTESYLSLGDKFLYANRCYYVKHSGYTKASLEELKKKLGG